MAERRNVAGRRDVRVGEYETLAGEAVFTVNGEAFEAVVTRHGARYFVTWSETVEGATWCAGWWAPPEIRDVVAPPTGLDRNMWFELLGGTAGNYAWRSDECCDLDVGLESPKSRWTARRMASFVEEAENVAARSHADLIGLDRVIRVKGRGGEWVAFVFAARIRHLPYKICVAGPSEKPAARRWLVLPHEPDAEKLESSGGFIRFVAGSPYERSVNGSPWFESTRPSTQAQPRLAKPVLHAVNDDG